MGRTFEVADIAASFQDSVCDVLTKKAIDACLDHDVKTLIIGGGVAANGRLRQFAEERAPRPASGPRAPYGPVHRQRRDGRGARAEVVRRGLPPSSLDLPADSSMPVTHVVAA